MRTTKKCGTAEEVSRLLSFTEQQEILAARSVSDGCGVDWYSCDSNHSTKEAYHRVRTCAKGVWRTRYTDYTNGSERYRAYTCGDSFRNCMPHVDYHRSSIFKDAHSETDDTVSSSSSGCSNASGSDYCNDAGTCSTKSAQGVPGTCGHNWCCCADYDNSGSSSTGSTPPSNNGGNTGGSTPPPACDHSSCTLYGCTITGCGQNYWSCEDHVEDFSCSNCGTSLARCSNISSVRCYSCDELN